MQIAIFTGMMPVTVQDYIYSIVEDGTLYETVKEKVRAIVSNKVAMNMGPAPMDVGGVATKPTWETTWEEEWHEEECEVGAVDMNTKCYRCQGYGHMSRDCGTKPKKGKGKGDSKGTAKGGKSQGKGNDGPKGGKSKGKGKGFAGSC